MTGTTANQLNHDSDKQKGYSLQAIKPTLATLLLALPVLAAHAAEPAPNAGSILQQNQQLKPPAAASGTTGLTIQQEGRGNLPPSAPFHVSAIEISGNTQFDTATLHALVAEAEGKDLSLPQLEDIIARITDYYRDHGYPLARAAIPAQTIQGGVVHVLIVEARYSNIIIDNHSRVVDSLLQQTLATLQNGQQVQQKPLDHALLLLSDIPGVAPTATLKPGATVGTSDLLVEAAPTAPVTGSLALDNNGNRATGRNRLGGNLNIFDPLHIGDILSAGVMSSGSDMNYGSLSYEALLNGQGTRAGASYTALHYILGDTLAAVGGHGTAAVASLWARQPLLRSRELNLSLRLQYDHKKLEDDIDQTGIQTARHLDNWTISLNGDARDHVLGGAANTWSLALTGGDLGFDNASAQVADAAAAKTQGSFSKWTLTYARLQGLSEHDALYVNLFGQWANNNLDPSEKMVAGGPYTVRGYDMGALSGDQGALLQIELRHELGKLWAGQTQVSAFIDSEHVTINHDTWTSGDNGATLSGAGVGLNWAGADQWSAKAYVAAPVGATPALIGHTNSARAWLEIDKGF